METVILSSSSSPAPFPSLLRNHYPPTKQLKTAALRPIRLRFPSLLKAPSISFTAIHLLSPIPPSLASETLAASPAAGYSDKINLESVLVSIDDLLTANPFLVSGCLFIWLIAVPFGRQYLRKFRFLSAIDAFRKLRDDPEAQLLDIRDSESVDALCSPNLKIVNKSVFRIEFGKGGDEDGFVKKALGLFPDPENTVLCILDNVDDNSLRAAELLVENGFKRAFAIKGGAKGKKGWVAIQKTMLPPSVRMLKNNKANISEPGSSESSTVGNDDDNSSGDAASATSASQNGHLSSVKVSSSARKDSRSPYPNYPHFKPPSSPIPSKPKD